ncbi:hypothetical protein PROFUN_16437, partial [Planoprotostelium fungivorum]
MDDPVFNLWRITFQVVHWRILVLHRKIRENDENIRNKAVPTARLKNAYASMNQYLCQAALLWKTVRPDEEFTWETLFNRSFIKIWIWFWDKRASVGETSFATPQNRVKGYQEVNGISARVSGSKAK